jgi:hypothetical protein
MYIDSEDQIRKEIREKLFADYLYRPNSPLLEAYYAVSMNANDFKEIFFTPWANFLKGVLIEAKKIASSAVLTLRLLFTINQKKAQEMIARHKDRMKEFEKESEQIFEKLGGDAALNDAKLMLFFAAPGVWALGKLKNATETGATGALDFAREIGIGDKSIATVKGEEKEEDALIRRRDQAGPVTKALRALEQIFLLASHSPSGDVLAEQAMPSSLANQIEAELLNGPMGATIKAQQLGMEETVNEFIALVNSTAAQNAFLASVAQMDVVENPDIALQEMQSALNELQRTDPESAKEFSDLPSQIKIDAQKLADDEDFVRSVMDSSDNEEKPASGELVSNEALKAVLGEVFAGNIDNFIGLINANKELVAETFEDLFPEDILTPEVVMGINTRVPGFKDSIRLAERLLDENLRA